MTSPSPAKVLKSLQRWGVNYQLVPGYNTSRIDPYKGRSDFDGIVLHHTAGRDSLNYIVNGNPYAPVRACHFLVNRQGGIHVVSLVGAYHAGEGGPHTFKRPEPTTIPEDGGNSRLYGIEIESLGTRPDIDGSPGGMTVGQVIGTAKLCAALLDAMGYPAVESRVIRHRDWTRRKVDVRQGLKWWRDVIRLAVENEGDKAATGAAIKAYVRQHPKGSSN